MADKKFLLWDKVTALFKKIISKRSLAFFAGIFSCFLIGTATEYALSRFVLGANYTGSYFDSVRMAYCIIPLMIIFVILFEGKRIAEKAERTVFLLIILCGLLMIICQPFGAGGFDTDFHYKWSLGASFYKTACYTKADMAIIKKTEDFPRSFSYEQSEKIADWLNENDNEIIYKGKSKFTVAHIPAGLTFALCRLFKTSFKAKYIAGEIANLFVYALVVFFALRKLKSGKMLLSAIALFPTSVFLASNYSYDYWVICFSLLGMAYLSNQIFSQKNSSVKDTVIMCSAFAVAALPKLIYAPLLIIPFFAGKSFKDKKQKNRYILIVFAFLIVSLVLFALKCFEKAETGGDMRGGEDVNAVGQLEFILSNPFTYLKTLIKFLTKYLSPKNIKGYTVLFGNFGCSAIFYPYFLLVLIASFTDKSGFECYKNTVAVRIITVIICFVITAGIATALYVDYTPVGLNTVNGCQPRYLLPLIFPFFSVLFGKGIAIKKISKRFYNTVYLSLLSFLFVISVVSVFGGMAI